MAESRRRTVMGAWPSSRLARSAPTGPARCGQQTEPVRGARGGAVRPIGLLARNVARTDLQPNAKLPPVRQPAAHNDRGLDRGALGRGTDRRRHGRMIPQPMTSWFRRFCDKADKGRPKIFTTRDSRVPGQSLCKRSPKQIGQAPTKAGKRFLPLPHSLIAREDILAGAVTQTRAPAPPSGQALRPPAPLPPHKRGERGSPGRG